MSANPLPTSDDETKQCPDCAEDVRAAARKCRYCQCEFSAPGRPQQAAPEMVYNEFGSLVEVKNPQPPPTPHRAHNYEPSIQQTSQHSGMGKMGFMGFLAGKCTHCMKKVSRGAARCPHCHLDPFNSSRS